jgi:pyroglutamyl-peptidase
MPERLQTLLTGFGPFGNVVSNPTERLIAHFARKEIPGHDLTARVLPVSFGRVPEIMRAEIEIGGRDGRPFDRILMLGVNRGCAGWRVELFGRNHDGAITDVDGFTPEDGPILPEGPEILASTLPNEALGLAIEQLGLPVATSEMAGKNLCNHILYTTLHHLQAIGHSARAGFLHVPADDHTFTPGITTAPMFPFEQHIAAVRAALEVLTNPISR